MKKTFNFQELIKYIEDNKMATCKIETDKGHSSNSLGELLHDLSNENYDCYLFEELNKMKYIVDIKGMTFEEALKIYRQNQRTLFDVVIRDNKKITETLSTILSNNTHTESWDILNTAEFFIA